MTGALSLIPLQASQPSIVEFLFPLGAMFLIFYFLVIRPQNKQQREKDELIASATRGDKVLTRGGIHGVISSVEDKKVVLEIAKVKGTKVEVTVERSFIETIIKPEDATSKKEGSEAS